MLPVSHMKLHTNATVRPFSHMTILIQPARQASRAIKISPFPAFFLDILGHKLGRLIRSLLNGMRGLLDPLTRPGHGEIVIFDTRSGLGGQSVRASLRLPLIPADDDGGDVVRSHQESLDGLLYQHREAVREEGA